MDFVHMAEKKHVSPPHLLVHLRVKGEVILGDVEGSRNRRTEWAYAVLTRWRVAFTHYETHDG